MSGIKNFGLAHGDSEPRPGRLSPETEGLPSRREGDPTLSGSRDRGLGGEMGRRRFLRLTAYAVPAAVILDVAWTARVLAQSPPAKGGGLEWPEEEEYGGPFPVW